MIFDDWKEIYRTIEYPLVVVKREESLPLLYINELGISLFNKDMSMSYDDIKEGKISLFEMAKYKEKDLVSQVSKAFSSGGYVLNHPATLVEDDGNTVPVLLTGNTIKLEDGEYIMLLISDERENVLDDQYFFKVMNHMFELSAFSFDIEDSINQIMRICGEVTDVSRVYVVEPISETHCKNTYEWCNHGITPEIEFLSYVDRETFGYNEYIKLGGINNSDVDTIEGPSGDILREQGIKSITIMPFKSGTTEGFVGFDDCVNKRKWSTFDRQLLEMVGSIIAGLLIRKKSEDLAKRSLDTTQMILDGMDSLVLVNTVDTYEIKFANKAFLDTVNAGMKMVDPNAEELTSLVGFKCYEIMQPGSCGPCDNCAYQHMKKELGETASYEYYSESTDQWFTTKDSVIEWIDGGLAHLESSMEITKQKRIESELEYYASTDPLTKSFSRKWGQKFVDDILETRDRRDPVSLVYIDIDNLKTVNDTIGHSAGDDLIIGTIDFIKKHIRSTDAVIRWGGDEFLVLMHSNIQHTRDIMQKVQDLLTEKEKDSNLPYNLSFSYGIIALDESIESLEQAISIADKEMYENKKTRKKATRR